MRVLITGGTGFVGSHVAVALMEAGHEVRLLARRPDQVPRTFAAHGVVPTDVVAGDVRDPDAIATALKGCDSVVHAAAIFSLRPDAVAAINDTNVAATRTVLRAAVAAGCDPVVHISTFAVLLRRGGSGPDLPLGDIDHPYTASKRMSEVVARDFQHTGAPVVSIYPGGVLGPDDPYLGDQNNRLGWIARGLMPVWPKGGFHVVDVRDVAATVAACMPSGRGPRRYVVPGTHARGHDLYSAVRAVVGRRRPHIELGGSIIALTRASTQVNRVLPKAWYYPADTEGATVTLRDTRLDDSPARAELGIVPRPFPVTVADTIAWMVDAGHLPPRLLARDT